MLIRDAQHEVRTVYLGGSVGQWVSGAIWFASAACAIWVSQRLGIIVLVIGGMFIYPLTQLVLTVIGRRASLSAQHPFRELAMEIAFIVPLLLPLVGAATMHRLDWFYPAMMLVVGAHYLPFAFLYGMRAFLGLAGAMIGAALLIGILAPQAAAWGGLMTACMLIIFGFIGRAASMNQNSPPARSLSSSNL